MKNYPNIPQQKLYEARDELAELISQRAGELKFQRFFKRCPYVLSSSLPLKLLPNDIIALGRPGITEPDFIFFPNTPHSSQFYGVIELKKPSSIIVTVNRKNVILLTRDAMTAVQQSRVYSRSLENKIIESNSIFIGNKLFNFVIMGISEDIAFKLSSQLMQDQIKNQLPSNCQIIPYDTLLHWFECNLPLRTFILVPNFEKDQILLLHGNNKTIDDKTMLFVSQFLTRLDYKNVKLNDFNSVADSYSKIEADIFIMAAGALFIYPYNEALEFVNSKPKSPILYLNTPETGFDSNHHLFRDGYDEEIMLPFKLEELRTKIDNKLLKAKEMKINRMIGMDNK